MESRSEEHLTTSKKPSSQTLKINKGIQDSKRQSKLFKFMESDSVTLTIKKPRQVDTELDEITTMNSPVLNQIEEESYYFKF